jgi:hypothetical protein
MAITVIKTMHDVVINGVRLDPLLYIYRRGRVTSQTQRNADHLKTEEEGVERFFTWSFLQQCSREPLKRRCLARTQAAPYYKFSKKYKKRA